MKTKVFTPEGKAITIRRYVVLKEMEDRRGNENECKYGHFGCAAWHKGPCLDEMLGVLETDGRGDA
jgi:hypothetical protein